MKTSDFYKLKVMQNRTDRNFLTVQSNDPIDILRVIARALDRTADAEHMARLYDKKSNRLTGPDSSGDSDSQPIL